jgi:hypothetical protein
MWGVRSFRGISPHRRTVWISGARRYWRGKMVVTDCFPENDPSNVTVNSKDKAATARMMMRVDRSTFPGRALALGAA